jgi:hypothetical protein
LLYFDVTNGQMLDTAAAKSPNFEVLVGRRYRTSHHDTSLLLRRAGACWQGRILRRSAACVAKWAVLFGLDAEDVIGDDSRVGRTHERKNVLPIAEARRRNV